MGGRGRDDEDEDDDYDVKVGMVLYFFIVRIEKEKRRERFFVANGKLLFFYLFFVPLQNEGCVVVVSSV